MATVKSKNITAFAFILLSFLIELLYDFLCMVFQFKLALNVHPLSKDCGHNFFSVCWSWQSAWKIKEKWLYKLLTQWHGKSLILCLAVRDFILYVCDSCRKFYGLYCLFNRRMLRETWSHFFVFSLRTVNRSSFTSSPSWGCRIMI